LLWIRWRRGEVAAKRTEKRKSGARLWRRLLSIASACVLCVANGHAALKTLAEYRGIYKRKNAEIAAAHGEVEEGALDEYARNLIAAKEFYRKKGDLDGITALKSEIERFATHRTVLEESNVKTPALLRQARVIYRKVLADAEVARDRRTLALVRDYMRPLDALKKDLVRREKLDGARRVDDEIKRMRFLFSETATRLRNPSRKEGVDGVQTPPAAQRRGLVAYYSFTGVEGNSASDDSGNGRGGTIRGARKVTEGKVGAGLALDGEDDVVIVPRSAHFERAAHTVAMWMKPRTSRRWQGIAGYWLMQATENFGYGLVLRPDGYCAFIEAGGLKWDYARTDTTLVEGKWHHLVGVRDGKRTMLYLNGVLQKRTTEMAPAFRAGVSLMIGGSGRQGQYFDGVVDEIMVYDRALSSQEVRVLFDHREK